MRASLTTNPYLPPTNEGGVDALALPLPAVGCRRLPPLCRWTFACSAALLAILLGGAIAVCAETLSWRALVWHTDHGLVAAAHLVSFGGLVLFGIAGDLLLLRRRWLGLPIALAFTAAAIVHFACWVVLLRTHADIGAPLALAPAAPLGIAAAAFIQLAFLGLHLIALQRFLQWLAPGDGCD